MATDNLPAERWIPVCRLSDIVPDTGVCALVGIEQVAIFRLDDDSLYAISNHDPFSGANVLSRGIVGDLKGKVVVASPVYKQHFSLESGQCLEHPSVRVAVFDVVLQEGAVCIRQPAPAHDPVGFFYTSSGESDSGSRSRAARIGSDR